jgi:anti-sigma regulatory factor (Ser/Thr protein kinase)
MKNSAVIKIPSHPKYLCVVRSVTAVMGELYGMPAAEIEDVKLAVDEACSNVIKYAYSGDTDQRIVVKFKITKKGFEVIIEDNGLKTHPEFIEGRSLNDIRPGGLGIHLIRRAFDVFAFDKNKKEGNRLRLIRYIKGMKENNEN